MRVGAAEAEVVDAPNGCAEALGDLPDRLAIGESPQRVGRPNVVEVTTGVWGVRGERAFDLCLSPYSHQRSEQLHPENCSGASHADGIGRTPMRFASTDHYHACS